MGKPKFYVVWIGRKTGIFTSWEECSEQIKGFPNATYKSFPTKKQAEEALKMGAGSFVGKQVFKTQLSPQQLALKGKPIEDSIAVDGAWNTATGDAEYQGVHTSTKKLFFKMGPFNDGTNNIVEFLAIVHALAFCKQHGLYTTPIYSDSRTAMSWVKRKEVKTTQVKTETNQKIFELLDRAVKWLHENEYKNPILKWETKAWGENPADFGRK